MPKKKTLIRIRKFLLDYAVSERTLRRWIADGKLKRHWRDGNLFIDLDAAVSVWASYKQKPAANRRR